MSATHLRSGLLVSFIGMSIGLQAQAGAPSLMMQCGDLTALPAKQKTDTAAALLRESGITPSDGRIALLLRTCSYNSGVLVQDAVSGDAKED